MLGAAVVTAIAGPLVEPVVHVLSLIHIEMCIRDSVKASLACAKNAEQIKKADVPFVFADPDVYKRQVTGDSVSEDFPISPPPSVGVVPIHTSGGRISASAGAQFPVRAPERPGAGPSSTKDGRQSWKTASPR